MTSRKRLFPVCTNLPIESKMETDIGAVMPSIVAEELAGLGYIKTFTFDSSSIPIVVTAMTSDVAIQSPI